MSQVSRLVHCHIATAVVLSVTASAAAATYSFTNIMDSTVPTPNGNDYVNIGDAAISGNRVAFKAREEGFVSHDSIFTSTGGPRTLIVETPSFAPSDDTSYGRPPDGGRFLTLGRPVIDGGPVYFDAQIFYPSFNYGDGIFFGEGLLIQNRTAPLLVTSVSPRAQPAFQTYRTIADPLKSNGYLSYRKSAGANSALDTIQVRNPETASTTMIVGAGSPAPQGGTFSSIDVNYDLSGPTVAFRGVVGSQQGIFTGAGGPLTSIVKQGDATPLGGTFDSVLDPTISGSTVAFLGTYAGGSGIFSGDGGALSAIVKTGDATPGGQAFTGFSNPTIAFNTVAFRGDYAGGGGIYTKRGDELNKVIEIGDSLFGSTVASLTFSDLGLDAAGSGNLAFTYGLADGRSGVTRANPGAGPPTIFQDLYGRIPVPDSVGINWVPVADFSGRNLTKAWLEGANLQSVNGRNANLTNAILRGADLTDADLSGANLRGAVFDTARLNGANLSGAQVRGARFAREYLAVVDSCFIVGCFPPKAVGHGGITSAQLASTASYQAHDLSAINLAGNDLSNLNLAGQNLTGTNFTLAKLTGADLTGAEIRKASFGRYAISATLEDCNYGPCSNFTGVIGSGITLDQLYSTKSYLAHDLTGINFRGNNLSGGDFAGHNLTNTSFNDATLTDAIFTGAEVRGANFSVDIDTPPYGTGITSAQLYSTASYQAHNLSGIVLEHNNLAQWSFAGQNLTNASFRGAALTEADFSGAEVRGAVFSGDGRRFRYGDAVEGVVIRGIEVYGSGITPAQLYSTASYQAHDLRGTSFDYNDLSGANLAGQNLSNAKFYGASLAGANLSQANLTGAAFGADDFPRVGPISAFPTSLDVRPAYLAGANLSGANLTNANFSGLQLCDAEGCDSFSGADLRGADLSLADARGASFFLARLAGANTANLIQSNGHIAGLDLTAGASLVVRDYDGNPLRGVAPPTGPLPITVDQHFMTGPGGTLQMMFDADAWDSTVSFAAGIPVTLDGTLELDFAEGTNVAGQFGRTFRLFDWTGVAPTGAFHVTSPYTWNLSRLYSTGEIALASVPEPSTFALAAFGVLGLISCARRRQHLGGIVLRSVNPPRRVARRLQVAGLCMICSAAPCAAEVLVSQNLGASAYTASGWWSPGAEPEHAFDGSLDFAWNAAGYPMQWLEVDLQQSYNLTSFKLNANQSPVGNTTHEVWLSNSAIQNDLSGASLIHTFSGFTSGLDVLTLALPSSALAQFVQIRTTQSPSWVSWDEIQVFAAIPEPTTFALAAVGVLGLIARRGRRKSAVVAWSPDHATLATAGLRSVRGKQEIFGQCCAGSGDPRTKVRLTCLCLVGLFLASASARADIFQWEYIDPANPALGKKQSALLAPGGLPEVGHPRPGGGGVNALPGSALDRRNLTMAYLEGANLAGSSLYNSNLADAYLHQANLTGVNLQYGNFTGADFSKANLSGAYSFLATFTNASLNGANLAGAGFDSTTLSGADFTDAQVTGANFTRSPGSGGTGVTLAQLYSTASYKARDLNGIKLEQNDLAGANFAGQNLTNAGFAGATLTNADLSHSNLGNAAFAQLFSFIPSTNLTGTSFIGANLIGAELRGATLTGTNFSQANLTNIDFGPVALLAGVNFSQANLTNANLQDTILTDANFAGAEVRGANFGRSQIFPDATGLTFAQLTSTASYQARNLSGIDLSSSNLSGANFADQNLTDVTFEYATLSGANFAGADVRGANFFSTGLTASQLTSTASYQARELTGIRIGEVNLSGINFSGYNLANAFIYSNLTGANLRQANLANTRLGATLTNADLTQANLTNVVFTYAILDGANFNGAVVSGANFSFASGFTPAQLYSTASYQARDLTGIKLDGHNLTGVDLVGQNLTGAILGNLDIYGNSTVLTDANLSQANLTNADLRHATLTGANLTQANFTNANFELATLTAADFSGAEVRGAGFGRDPNFGGGTGLTLVQIYSTASYLARDLSGIRLERNNLAGANFAGQNLTNAYLYGTTLTNANLSQANLTDAQLNGNVTLTNANLTQANLSNAELVGARLNGAKFRQANLGNATLELSTLAGADFTQADLTSANFHRANLTGANLSGAILTGVNLAGATLTNVNFTDAVISGSNLAPVRVYSYSQPGSGVPFIGPFGDNLCGLWKGDCHPQPDAGVSYGTGITLSQLYETASHKTGELTNVNLSGSNFNGADFTNRNLANSYFFDTTMVSANLTGADARGSFGLTLTQAVTRNFIGPNGHIAELELDAGQTLILRDYDGNTAASLGPMPIVVDQLFSVAADGGLRLLLESDAWDSTISFAAGIPVTRGGSLELLFANGVNVAGQVGRTFRLFDWTGVAPTGSFHVVSPYAWNSSNLYTTGEVTLAGVPEPSSLSAILAGTLCLTFRRRRNRL